MQNVCAGSGPAPFAPNRRRALPSGPAAELRRCLAACVLDSTSACRLTYAAAVPGLTTGTVEAVGPDTIQVGGVIYRLSSPELLAGLRVGLRVTVVWGERDGQLRATNVTLERQQ